jgi:transposase
MQSLNGQLPPQLGRVPQSKRHTAKLLDGRKRQAVITALANGESKRRIARRLSVSANTVTELAEQEWRQVEARKQRIAAQAELNATLAAERMTDKLQSSDDIPLNTLVSTFGVAVDKMVALRGDVTQTNPPQVSQTLGTRIFVRSTSCCSPKPDVRDLLGVVLHV